GVWGDGSEGVQPADGGGTAGTITSRAASPPGQSAPAPSTPQNVPKDVSMTPTASFIQFSGTRASGALTATPVSVTSTTAATAPITAAPMLCWLAPNVSTMNTTSSPSRSTPLNAGVNEYQSPPPRLACRGAASAAP